MIATEDHLSLKYIKVEEKVKTEVIIRETIKVGTDYAIDQAVEIGDSLDEIMRDPDCSKITEGTIFKKALGDIEDKAVKGNIEMIGVMIATEVGTGQEKDHPQGIIAIAEIEAQGIVDQDQHLEPVPIGTE